MSATNNVLYTSQTGVESPEPTIVEPVVSKKIRVNDPTYGLKTAAAVTKERVDRETFLRQKAEAIARQHAREAEKRNARASELDADIARIRLSLISGKASDPEKVRKVLATLEAKRQALS